ncbi:MAG: prephenate dehydrogenase [Chloroflexi bacterium]|nr:prephenate dehydrogenase [Chloroflexota bacterium]MBT4305678.1 prephenate dehydrogenase [Chloroflexota bacterium]MBT5336791.1 prephenate dehydrogenase [Chloroflexota bacterium]MBT6988032.1 prephenate dehydrogenase [Chloroflexota bacterium]
MAIKNRCNFIVGVDTNSETLKKAKGLNIFDNLFSTLEEISPKTDIIILAVPVDKIIEILANPRSITSKNAIIMDVGSSKVEILRVMKSLPESFQAIGGHPICGKENLSIENAEANLFQDSPFVLTTLERTTELTIKIVTELIELLGATPLYMTAEEHDMSLAATSHVPFLVASALALSVPIENKNLIGTGYGSTARLAATPSSMMLNVLLSNKKNVTNSVEKVRDNLDQFIDLLNKEDSVNLEATLVKCASHHKKLISD